MKRKNTTRNALFTSIMSLLLCVSMMVGTTFAWFTDSVVSGNNVIAAGNLDIDLYNDGNKVTSQTNLFDGVKWEPGVVDYENFTIKNEGNLALLYNFAMNWGSYNTLEGRSLTEILKVAMVDGHVSGDRAAAIAAGEAAGWAALDSWSFKGEMTTKDETKDFALIIYWEPSDNDNNYNVQNGKETSDGQPLYVNLGINLQATQKMHEEDSFGKDYDSLANPWDGSVGKVPEADKEGVITITTAAELAAFAADVNRGTTYSGKTVKLGADINLGNVAWTAIGDCESRNYFQGTFDGQGHTIYNLNVDYSTDASEHATAGLFGWVDAAMATVKNVNIAGATVKGSHWVGVIAGYFTGRIENCSVNNATVIGNNVNDEANGDKVGGIVGYMNSGAGKLDGNTVTNSTITGNRDVAGLAGAVATTNAVTNNKVENVTVNYSSDYVGEIVSPKTAVVVDDTNTASNVKIIRVINVQTVAELNDALAQDENVVLSNNITFTGVKQMPDRNNYVEVYGNKTGFAQYGGVLDGNGFELIDSEGDKSYVVVTHGGTIKNLTIKSGARGIVTYSPTEDVYIDNVVVDGAGYALNSTEHSAVNMVVTNSTINGWTSLAGFKSVSFNNCKLGENSLKYWQGMGYGQDFDRLFRVYSPTTYTRCEFEQGYYLDLSAGGTATLIDCTVNGVEITAENYALYITIELPTGVNLADCVNFK